MKSSRKVMWVVALTLFIAMPAASASSIWYVDGVNGNDTNDCKTRQTACKTIGHAVSLASPGDTIGIGPATYMENLSISISLNLIGSGANTTTIDGGQVNSVVTIHGFKVTLSDLTIQNGLTKFGGGINNAGNLTVIRSPIAGNSTENTVSGPRGGGGIYNSFRLTVDHSTISGNVANGFSSGGGIYNGYNYGQAMVTSTTARSVGTPPEDPAAVSRTTAR